MVEVQKEAESTAVWPLDGRFDSVYPGRLAPQISQRLLAGETKCRTLNNLFTSNNFFLIKEHYLWLLETANLTTATHAWLFSYFGWPTQDQQCGMSIFEHIYQSRVFNRAGGGAFILLFLFPVVGTLPTMLALSSAASRVEDAQTIAFGLPTLLCGQC